MVEQVLERRRDAVIIFAADDQETVGTTIECREPFQGLGRLARRILLVHPIKQRKLQLKRVDQQRLVPARFKRVGDQMRGADAHSVAADRAQEDGDGEGAHDAAAVRTISPPQASWRMKPSVGSTGARHGALSSVSIVWR